MAMHISVSPWLSRWLPHSLTVLAVTAAAAAAAAAMADGRGGVRERAFTFIVKKLPLSVL